MAKYLVPLLAPLTSNEYSVKNYFIFAEQTGKQNTNLFMASLDVGFLFTNIPLEETSNICCEDLFTDCDAITRLNKNDVYKLLPSCCLLPLVNLILLQMLFFVIMKISDLITVHWNSNLSIIEDMLMMCLLCLIHLNMCSYCRII